MALVITTNNVPRDIVDGWNVPADVRADFTYVDWDSVDRGQDGASFVQYRGCWYDLNDMQSDWLAPREGSLGALGFHMFEAQTYFSGVAFKYPRDADSSDPESLDGTRVVCARFYVSD